jgi:hypothetical protein
MSSGGSAPKCDRASRRALQANLPIERRRAQSSQETGPAHDDEPVADFAVFRALFTGARPCRHQWQGLVK